jgi:hypothetical protein
MSAGGEAASPASPVNTSGRGNEDAGRGAMAKANYLIAGFDRGNTHLSYMQPISLGEWQLGNE